MLNMVTASNSLLMRSPANYKKCVENSLGLITNLMYFFFISSWSYLNHFFYYDVVFFQMSECLLNFWLLIFFFLKCSPFCFLFYYYFKHSFSYQSFFFFLIKNNCWTRLFCFWDSYVHNIHEISSQFWMLHLYELRWFKATKSRKNQLKKIENEVFFLSQIVSSS